VGPLVAIPDIGRVTWAVTLAVAGAPEESTASVFQTEAVRTPGAAMERQNRPRIPALGLRRFRLPGPAQPPLINACRLGPPSKTLLLAVRSGAGEPDEKQHLRGRTLRTCPCVSARDRCLRRSAMHQRIIDVENLLHGAHTQNAAGLHECRFVAGRADDLHRVAR
jgi:hypothetical protein